VASAVWRLRRVTAYEQAAIAEREHLDTASARWLLSPLDNKIIRYEAHLSPQFYLAVHELESMRAARRGQPAPLIRVDVHGEAKTTRRHGSGDGVRLADGRPDVLPFAADHG
jgi:hypothetical protein